MKVALVPINIGMQSLEQIVGLAQLAESLGYESVWTFEHVMVPLEYESRYPYSKDGKMGGGSDAAFLDPLIALTAVAAHTKTLRLGTGVNILSQANPLLLAKQAAKQAGAFEAWLVSDETVREGSSTNAATMHGTPPVQYVVTKVFN